MEFSLLSPYMKPGQWDPDGAYLESNNWDDFGFKTTWNLWLVNDSKVFEIGEVKIGDRESNARPSIPKSFSKLPTDFFSLGQDENYYDRLNQVAGGKLRTIVLTALRDIALNSDLMREVERYTVATDSLFRFVKPVTVRTQLRRIAHGGLRLSPYSFSYSTPKTNRSGTACAPVSMDFHVDPTTTPKSNIHVLIGRNGVGKSFILHDMTMALTKPEDSAGVLEFHQTGDDRRVNRFTNVVTVAFSAFDSFKPIRQRSGASDGVNYTYIGLKNIAASKKDPTTLKDHVALASLFGQSLKDCVESGRLERWQSTVAFLHSDPIFADAIDRLSGISEEKFREEARAVFSELSSGHKIVLLTLTRLVQTVEEATLVLLDEPESHLHPPLLSSFMRALTELLETRNAAAIVVTHSPVVLQEVPKSCVWKLGSFGTGLQISRPTMETFGENVGTLTQEVFGLEVTASGFHRTLAEVVDEVTAAKGGVEDVLDRFDNQLGAEARALAQSMIYFAER